MLEVDRDEFTRVMQAYLGKNAEPSSFARWWYALKPYELVAIKEAFIQRDREMGGYPEPKQIIDRLEAKRRPEPQAWSGDGYWLPNDLIVACGFKAVDWSERTGPSDWADRVARAYDTALAETAARVVSKYPDLQPADAARAFLESRRTERAVWMQRKAGTAAGTAA